MAYIYLGRILYIFDIIFWLSGHIKVMPEILRSFSDENFSNLDEVCPARLNFQWSPVMKIIEASLMFFQIYNCFEFCFRAKYWSKLPH